MKKLLSILSTVLLINASETSVNDALSLSEALTILKTKNLEIKSSSLDVDSARAEAKTVSGTHWGKLNFIQDVVNSDDAGNVFGFKVASREATFGDFGFSDFMACQSATPPAYCADILNVKPDDLNKPESRTFFQTKLKYELPLFTGFQISSYENIMNSMTKMKTLEHKQVINEKTYQLRKSFYDMALLRGSTKHLNTILQNINTLENMTKVMIEVGYAKKVDLLEVQAKKGNVNRLLMQMESNKKLLYSYISFLLNQKITQIIIPSSHIEMPKFTNEEILLSNIDIQRASTGLEVRKNMVDVSKSEYYPMVGAFAEMATADDSFLGDAGDHMAYTVGARLTWNLFNGGVDSSKVQKSQIEYLKTRSQVELAKKGISLQVDKLKTEISTYDFEILSLEKELILANEIYKNYEGRYKEKLSSMSDVIIKQSEQIQKILQLQMTQNKRNERIFALEKIANGDKYENK